MSLIRSGVVSVTFRALSPKELIDLSAKAGLMGIEWGSDVHVLPGDVKTAREVREMTEASGLAVASYGSYYYAAYEANKAPFEAVLESAVALGAPNIRVWAGLGASKDADAAKRSAVAEDLLRCADLARSAGITLSLEYHSNTLTDTVESTLQLLDEAKHDSLYTYWQAPLTVTDADQARELDLLLNTGRVSNAHVYRWETIDGNYVQQPLASAEPLLTEWLSKLNCDRERFACIEFVKDGTAEQFIEDAGVLNRILSKL